MGDKQWMKDMRAERQEAFVQNRAGNAEESEMAPGELTWAQAGAGAVTNFGPSAMKYAEDISAPIHSPIETVKGLYGFTKGLVELAIPGEQEDEKTVRAVGDYFANRYGTLKGFKEAVAEDPVGVVGDVAGVLTGGGMLAAKAPGVIGKGGKYVQDVGEAIDPLNVAVRGAGAAVDGIKAGVPAIVGSATGAGRESIEQAYNAGRVGGEVDQGFVDNMRGNEDPTAVVDDAVAALRERKQTKQNDFVSGRDALELEQVPIDFDAVAASVGDWSQKFFFEGTSELSKNGQQKLASIQDIIAEWQKSPALHNAKGLDMLKRRIDGEYPDGINPGDSAVVVAQARDLIKKNILEMVPGYNAVMKPYEQATRLEREMQKALSLGNNAAADTALRKLQSTMRNNVNANFGARLKLVEQLDEASGYFLMPRIAGQSLNSVTPRGLNIGTAGGTGIYGLTTNPAALAALPMFSPRVMGEASRGLGQFRGAIDNVVGGIDSVLSPFQRQLMSSAAGTPGALKFPANLSRMATTAMEAPSDQGMTREEFEKLKMMLNPEQRLIAPAP